MKMPAAQLGNMRIQSTQGRNHTLSAVAILPAGVNTAQSWLLICNSSSILPHRYSLGSHTVPTGMFSKLNLLLCSTHKQSYLQGVGRRWKPEETGQHASYALPVPHRPRSHVYMFSEAGELWKQEAIKVRQAPFISRPLSTACCVPHARGYVAAPDTSPHSIKDCDK